MRSAILLAILGAVFTHSALAQTVVYVDKANISGIEDGLSWSTAFTTLQPAVTAAGNAGGGEVWVAGGVYDEMREPPDARWVDTGTLIVPPSVDVLGGFTGQETDPSQREPNGAPTVIDGSKARAGTPALHVMFTQGSNLLDSLTITGGAALNHPTQTSVGGLWFVGDFVGRKLRVVGNQASKACAGAFGIAHSGHIELTDCEFADNVVLLPSTYGAGCDVSGLEARVERCVFRNNDWTGLRVAASHMRVVDCRFEDNGLALRMPAGGLSLPEAVNCVFWDNSICVRTEGGYDPYLGYTTASIRFTNCSFATSFATPPDSPAFQAVEAWLNLYNCIVWNCGETPVWVEGHVYPEIHHCLIQGQIHNEGVGELYNPGTYELPWSDPRFVSLETGDLRLRPSSPAIDVGTDTVPVNLPAPSTDIRGHARPQGAGWDLGAYEMKPVDVNGDGRVNAMDVQAVVNATLGIPLREGWDADADADGQVTALDVQWVVNALLRV